MIIEALIKEKIKKKFPDAIFFVENTSNKHKNHKQNKGGNETHFVITVKSKKFSKLSNLQRHKLFLKILGPEIINKTHSISMNLQDK
tara:strand:+ start:3061 stop:3321 length:261 start_codon:yes stop_codon:yes gene_type:complete